ncbi:methyltransferase domain-containing protein [Aminivibrio sp.]|uniref:methyltransferase domain-containing protein n=1 Tax=Aminivibrio sp. TaxID=1872489 RepID=UPI001A628266|nr:methyltransferase domain-containing protein [Aminivibrio sp.]MBL3538289.1 methyltransferase domain-containing protein [Aminivibrio sp.]
MQRYHITQNGFVDQNQNLSRTIQTELIEDETAFAKQDNSLDEYKETHEKENLSPQIVYLMYHFRRFIGYQIMTNLKQDISYTLDVGCEISRKIPLYFREINDCNKAIYIGLDPIPTNTNRDYLFINGKFEGLHQFLDTFFDCLIFSTSLDHFPDLEAVVCEIRKIIKKTAWFFLGRATRSQYCWRINYG